MRPSRPLRLGALALLLPTVGCAGRAISEGVGLVRDVSGIFVPVDTVRVALDAYERFELGTVTDDFGGRVPEEFFDHLVTEFVDEIGDRGIPNADSGRTLVVRGRIVHMETRAVSGILLGDFEEVVARLELVDRRSGEVLGRANCIGRSDDSVNRGIQKKAEGLAIAIARWIDEHYPDESKPDEDTAEDEEP